MANLTTEYLDKQLGKITKKIDNLDKKFEGRFEVLELQIKKTEAHLLDEIQDAGAITARQFEKADVREHVQKLEQKIDKVYKALNL